MAAIWNPTHHARTVDPHTSKTAALSAKVLATSQCDAILAYLQRVGQQGAEQIANALGMDAYAVRKRTADLQQRGAIRPVPGVSRKTSTGRSERVWEVV